MQPEQFQASPKEPDRTFHNSQNPTKDGFELHEIRRWQFLGLRMEEKRSRERLKPKPKNGMAISDTGSRKKWKKEKITISNSFSPLSSNFLPDSSNPPTELSAVLESQNKSIGVIWTKKSLPFDGF